MVPEVPVVPRAGSGDRGARGSAGEEGDHDVPHQLQCDEDGEQVPDTPLPTRPEKRHRPAQERERHDGGDGDRAAPEDVSRDGQGGRDGQE